MPEIKQDLRAATLIVSAANSLNRNMANFVCDGVGDEVEINAALNALPLQHGRVILLEGTYILAHPITIPGSYIILEGQGWSTLLDGDGLPTTEHGIIISSFSGVHIKNLAIQTMNGGGKTCHCIFIEDGANEFIIQEVYFLDSDSDAIHIEGTSINKGWILDNFIEGADDYGISVDMGALDRMTNLIISKNYIASVGVDGIYFGNTGNPADHCVISDNIIVTNDGCGIYAWTGVWLTINDNSLDNNLSYGIYLRDVSDSTIEDNIIQQSDLHNIYLNTCAQILVEGNYSYGAQDNAADNIHLDTNCSDCQAIGNYSIWAGRYGIFYGATRGLCSENRVASSGDDGIVIDAADFQVNGNHINDCGRDIAGTYHGIKVSGPSDRGQIISNYILSDGAVTQDGIHLASNAQYIQIVGNYCFNGMGSGIHLIDDNDYCLIKDNYCMENDDYGILIAAATCLGNTVENNKLMGNVTGQISDGGTDTALPFIYEPVHNPDSFIGNHPAEELIDGVITTTRLSLYVPASFQELVRIQAFVVAAAAGDMNYDVDTDYGKVCASEDYNTHGAAVADQIKTCVINDIECVDLVPATTLANLAASDLVGIEFSRDAIVGTDTIVGSVYLIGMRLQYV